MTAVQRFADEMFLRGASVVEVCYELDVRLARARSRGARDVLAALLDAFCDLVGEEA